MFLVRKKKEKLAKKEKLESLQFHAIPILMLLHVTLLVLPFVVPFLLQEAIVVPFLLQEATAVPFLLQEVTVVPLILQEVTGGSGDPLLKEEEDEVKDGGEAKEEEDAKAEEDVDGEEEGAVVGTNSGILRFRID